MADASDIEVALARTVAGTLYPGAAAGVTGLDLPGVGGVPAYGVADPAARSVAGLPVRIYRGWPVSSQLDPDLRHGIAHVTVFSLRQMGRLTGGWLNNTRTAAGGPATIVATAAGSRVILSGTITAGNLVGVAFDGQAFACRTEAGDTLDSVAARLAAAIGGGGLLADDGTPLLAGEDGGAILLGDLVAVFRDGATVVLELAASTPIIARTGGGGLTRSFDRQQTQGFTVTCWAPNPAARDAICGQFDSALAALRWLSLADQEARIVWSGTRYGDETSRAAVWRRDVSYQVTFWTTHTRQAATMLFGDAAVQVVS